MLQEIHTYIKIGAKYIDRTIAGRFLSAREQGAKVVDARFLEAFKKRHGENHEFEFFQSGRAVFVTAKTEEGNPPVLVTILTHDMIDGTVIRDTEQEDMKSLFNQWKFEARKRR